MTASPGSIRYPGVRISFSDAAGTLQYSKIHANLLSPAFSHGKRKSMAISGPRCEQSLRRGAGAQCVTPCLINARGCGAIERRPIDYQ